MEQKIVFFDVDGTLLSDENVIPHSTRRAVQLLQAKGIYTVIATGRIPTMIDQICKELHIQSYISINGQYVTFEGQEIYANPMDKEVMTEMTHLASHHGHAMAFCSHEDIRVTQEHHPFITNSFHAFNMPLPSVDPDYYKHSPIYQAHLYCESKDEQIYRERFPQYSFVRWHRYATDVLPKGSSKAIGISKLLEATGIKKENSFAFGDGLNDIEMLTLVGTGIAMGNASQEVKSAADIVTAACTEDGIFRGLVKVGLLAEMDVHEQSLMK